MHFPSRGIAAILACFTASVLSQTTYTFQSTPGAHPFVFSNPYPAVLNPLGDVRISTSITLHNIATNSDTAATILLASNLGVSTNVSAILSSGLG
jgi:hypothetical protein